MTGRGTDGRWIEFELAWNDTGVRNCPVCGKLVTRRAWEFETSEGRLRVCDPDCRELYESYYRPTHGPLAPGTLEGPVR